MHCPMGIEIVRVSVPNVLACKYIAPMGIEVIIVSVQNILSCNIANTLRPWV